MKSQRIYKKTLIKENVIKKFIDLSNRYVADMGYKWNADFYDIEFVHPNDKDYKHHALYSVLKPVDYEEIKADDWRYKQLMKIHDRLMCSPRWVEYSKSFLDPTDFKFLNELNKKLILLRQYQKEFDKVPMEYSGEFSPLDKQGYREFATNNLSASEKEAEEKNKGRVIPRSPLHSGLNFSLHKTWQ